MDKLIDKIIDELFKEDDFKKLIDKQINHNCEIHITKKGIDMKTEINGNSLMALITLKSVLKSLQEKLEVSDKELDRLMEGVLIVKGKRGAF